VKDQATEATIAAVANKVTYTGGTVALWGGWSANEIAAIGGLIIAALGLVVQLYYKRKDERRKKELHAAIMRGDVRVRE